MRRSVGLFVAAFACLVLLPNVAHAQSAIVGVVKDTSGAVLPGVTVEASSDVLIEKTRSVTTDGNGQYKIVDLRPGQYIVTFSLTGFAVDQTRKRGSASQLHERDQRGHEGRIARRVDHGLRHLAGRRRDDCRSRAGAQSRSDRRDSDGTHDSGHGTAHRRRQLEPAGHRRRARHAADLYVDARHDVRKQHRDGRRDDRERPAV